VKISRTELRKQGWKTIDLLKDGQELLEKDGRRITWSSRTQEIVGTEEESEESLIAKE